MAEDSEAVRRADALERRLRQLTAKVAKDGPTTAEDVHIAAVAWAVSDQREEAPAGTTTGPRPDRERVVCPETGTVNYLPKPPPAAAAPQLPIPTGRVPDDERAELLARIAQGPRQVPRAAPVTRGRAPRGGPPSLLRQ